MSFRTKLTGWSLRATARRHSVEALRERVERQRAELFAQTVGVSQEQADFRPAPEQWSIGEVIHHVVLVEEWVAQVLTSLARREGLAEPERPPDVGEHLQPTPGCPFEEVCRRLVEARRPTFQAVDALPAEPDPGLTWPHPLFGPLNAKEWLLALALHDRAHIRQIQRIKKSPVYPAA